MKNKKDEKIKKIKITIEEKEEEIDEGYSYKVYNVTLTSEEGTWGEVTTSKEHLAIIIHGINMAFGMMGVHTGISPSVQAPFTKEITV